jgi:predicted aspartyl protease
MTDELLFFGVLASFWVKTIVDLIKKAGLSDKWAIPAALVVGILLAVCNQLAAMFPQFALWLKVIVGGVTAALAAMNLYDVTHSLDKIAKSS